MLVIFKPDLQPRKVSIVYSAARTFEGNLKCFKEMILMNKNFLHLDIFANIIEFCSLTCITIYLHCCFFLQKEQESKIFDLENRIISATGLAFPVKRKVNLPIPPNLLLNFVFSLLFM